MWPQAEKHGCGGRTHGRAANRILIHGAQPTHRPAADQGELEPWPPRLASIKPRFDRPYRPWDLASLASILIGLLGILVFGSIIRTGGLFGWWLCESLYCPKRSYFLDELCVKLYLTQYHEVSSINPGLALRTVEAQRL